MFSEPSKFLKGEKSTVFETATPFYILSKWLALSPYELKANGVYGRSMRRLIVCVLYSVIFITSFYMNYDVTLNVVAVNSQIVYFLVLFDTCGNMVVMFSMWLLSHLHVRNEICIIERIEELDKVLIKHKKQKQLFAGNRKLWLISIVIIVFIFIVYYVCVETILVIYVFAEFDPIFTFIRFMPTAVTTAVEVNFFIWTTILRNRLTIINSMLEEKVKESRAVRGCYPSNSYRFETDVELVLDMHKQLTDVSKSLNSNYNVQLLLTFTILFVLVVGDAYLILFRVIIGNLNVMYVVYSALKLVAYHSFEMLMLIRSSSVLCYEANRTKDILLAIRISPENVESRNLIMASVLQLMYNRLEITALKFFKIDYNLLFSMFAAMTTYLLIMLQFEVEDK